MNNIVGGRTIRRALEHNARVRPESPFLIFEDRTAPCGRGRTVSWTPR
ncbi:MAG: hypothetical protein WKH64_13430 [Chloroflexia bacterium]